MNLGTNLHVKERVSGALTNILIEIITVDLAEWFC